MEPSGDAFNSFLFDERNNRPFNPMVNAGALVTTNLIHGKDRDEKVERLLQRLRAYAANPDLQVDEDVGDAERHKYNDRNLGLSYLMRSLRMIVGDIEENIDTYLSICAVRVNAQDLGTMGATLANGGVNPLTGQRVQSRECVRDVLTVMNTCGMYDAAGEWAYDVGIPAKSGVSGGIMIVQPNNFGGGSSPRGWTSTATVSARSRRAVTCRSASGCTRSTTPAGERLGLTTAD